jgi:PAS domain S-box-containing protein
MVTKATVLAVDDAPSNLIALQAVLSRDFQLVLANSGQEAISVLEARSDIDVILMDLQMPGMDGFEAARRIKQMQGCSDIPIVFITAVFRDDPFVKRGYEVGGVDYFAKPFDPDLLRLKMSIYASFRQKAAILKERERQIRETEELLSAGRKLTAVLESLPAGILISDTHGRICQINDEVSRICRATEVLENDAYGDILEWWDASGQTRALRSGQSSHNDLLQIRCVDGTLKTISASTSPLFGLDAQVVGAVIMIQDVTESRKIGAELEDRIARLVSLGVEVEQSIVRPQAAT